MTLGASESYNITGVTAQLSKLVSRYSLDMLSDPMKTLGNAVGSAHDRDSLGNNCYDKLILLNRNFPMRTGSNQAQSVARSQATPRAFYKGPLKCLPPPDN